MNEYGPINGKVIRGGVIYWYVEGMYHREDGPAIIYPDGKVSWRLFWVEKTEEEVLQHALKAGNKKAIKNILWRKYEL